MGKSTVGAMFEAEGIPLFDADAVVHGLQGVAGALVDVIEAQFPGTTGSSGVDRAALGARVMHDPRALRRLEAIIHPAVADERAAFMKSHANAPVVILDVPLLFETGGEAGVDRVIVVSAPADIQRARVLARPGMSEKRFDQIMARQMPDADKRARADFIITTDGPIEDTREQARRVIACVAGGEDG